jgi:Ni,Fe-hydrogenase III component G
MLIEYVLNGRRKEVRDVVGKRLIAVRAAREVVDGYMTRDMADQPKVQKVVLDSAGNPWDESLHVASKLQNKDGTWRKKPGAAASAESAE